MENTPRRYQEISLVDLLWYICSGWRVLVVGMMVCAILTGSYRIYKNTAYNAAVETEKQAQENISQTDGNPTYDALTESEMAAVDNAVECAQQLQYNLDYKNDSVYINLDPYHENVRILNYIVKVDKEQLEDDGMGAAALTALVKKSYILYINSGAVAGKIADTYNQLDETAISELVEAEDMDGNSAYQMGSFTTEGDTTSFQVDADKVSALFVVSVKGSSAEEAEAIADALDGALAEYTKTLTETLDTHQLTMSSSSAGVLVDQELAVRRQSFQSELTGTRTNLNNILEALSEKQKAAYDHIISGDEQHEEETAEKTENAPEAVMQPVPVTAELAKYLLFGLVIGLFLAAMVLALIYVMGPALKTTEDITGCFQYYLLADMSAHRTIKRRFGMKIDRWINQLRYRRCLPEEEEKKLLATNLKVTCQKEEVSAVYLTSSCVMSDEEVQMVQKLAETLKKDGITVSYGGSIERDAESYENMTNTGAVVYMEKLGKSRFASMENIHAMTVRQGVKILGVVAV